MIHQTLDAIRMAPRRIETYFAFARPQWINEITRKVREHAENQCELAHLVVDAASLDGMHTHDVLRVIFIANRLAAKEEKLSKSEEHELSKSIHALRILDHQVDRVSRELAESTIDRAEHQRRLEIIDANARAELAAHRLADQEATRRDLAWRAQQTRGQFKVNRIARKGRLRAAKWV